MRIIYYSKIISRSIILLLITSGLIGFIILVDFLEDGNVKASSIIVDCNGGGDYLTIQDALASAGDGDTILVWAGSYHESILVNKAVTIIGNNTINTIIKGTGSAEVVQITANWANISGFTITSNGVADVGISITNANNCNISNNTMVSCGLHIIGNKLTQWNTHVIDNSNTVNGKPLYYWKNINVGIIPPGAGQVILANCTNITVENQNLSNGSIGIQLGFSNHNSIENNVFIQNNKFGIHLYGSKLNIVANNTCNSNEWNAINLETSDTNIIINNTCLNNNNGINIYESNSNTIIHNTCNSNHNDGISITESSSNIIKNNTCNSNYDDGIDIFESGENTIINNTCISDNDYGIVLQNTKLAIIINNTMVSCGFHIIGFIVSQYDSHTISINNTVNGKSLYYWKNVNDKKIPSGAGQVILVNCSKIIIENQNLSNGSTGIELFFSHNNDIINNLCNGNNDYGIYLWRSDQNVLVNNKCNLSVYHGIILSESDSNTIANNTCNSNNVYGIYLKYSRSNTIINNICDSNIKFGIILRNSKYNIITYNMCNSNNYYGIYLDKSDSNDIDNNICNSNIHDGIWLGVSSLNTINNNTCNSNHYSGVNIETSYSNVVINNTCNSNTNYGIFFFGSISTDIINNTCLDNNYGIALSNSRLNNIINNNLSLNDYIGILLENAELNLIINNTCISNQWVGIEILQSDWNFIENNTCCLTDVGIYLHESHSNTIVSNVCNSNDYYGIYLKRSTSNLIIDNICSLNIKYGITLNRSSINTFENNNISNNGDGIYLHSGSNNNAFFENIISTNSNLGISIKSGCDQNRFFHNNIITNIKQAEEEAIGLNYWDNGNGEGNYWSDYLGLDNGSGGRVPRDGIGDTELPHLALDHHPFIKFSGWLYPGTPILINPGHVDVDPDGNYTLSWNHTRETMGYILEGTNNEKFIFSLVIYKGSKNIINITGKKEGIYFYRVRSFNEYYESNWSNIVNITVDHLPNIPQDLIVSVYLPGNALNLSWVPNLQDTKEYELYFKNDTITQWRYLDNITHTVNMYDHTNLSDGQTYYYKIRAIDPRNQYSSFSKSVSAIPMDSIAPNKPKGLSVAKSTIDSITLVWKANTEPDLEGYNIYTSFTGSPGDWGKPIHTTLKGTEEFIDININFQKPYYYVITAFDEVPNESGYSEMILGPFPPEINNSITDFELPEDTYDDSTINLYRWFKDVNNGPLYFHCDGQDHINVTIHQENGTVTLLPEKDWNGLENLTFFANDSVFEISGSVIINVTPVNDPPGIVEILMPKEGQKIENGTSINFTAICYDPDLPYGDELTFNWLSNISGELGVGEILTNITLPGGNHLITLQVSDIVGEMSNASVNVTVTDRDINGSKPDKSEDDSIFIFLSITICVIIIIIIILFIFPGFIFPGWGKLLEKINKKDESTTDLGTSAPPNEELKKSGIESSTEDSAKPSTENINKDSNESSEKAGSSEIENSEN